MATVQSIIALLKNKSGDIVSEGHRDLARKLRKFYYEPAELSLIEKQVLQFKAQEEDRKCQKQLSR